MTTTTGGLTAATLLNLVTGDDVGGFRVSVSGTMLAAFVSVAVAVISVAGVIVSSRLSKRAADKGHEIQSRAQRHTELVDYVELIKADLSEARAANAAQIVDHERREQLQAERCDAALSHAEENLHELQRIVHDEIAAAAVDVAIDDARRHRRTDHRDSGRDVAAGDDFQL